ncbi:MAG: glycosyltransferase family 9 protein [Nitrospinae bacterium]|nr:glycosyltransferase family 9 protein [Nitrospinota bacterium]
MTVDKKSIKKILVLRYRSIGDIILSGPALEALRLTYPSARIDMVVDDQFADICHGHPYIDYLLLHRRNRGNMSKFDYFMLNLKFIHKVRKAHYDLVVDLHSGPRSATLTLLSGARHRLGYRFRWRNKLAYNLAAPIGGPGVHTVEGLLQMLLPLNPVLPDTRTLRLAYPEEEKQFVRGFLEKHGVTDKDFLVMVHPGARVDVKRLPAEKMGSVVRWLIDELGAKVVYAGNNNDIAPIAEIVSYSGRRGLIATNLPLARLSALIGSCNLFLGNDSGPMHMAAALDVPVVAFFGPSDPTVWGPVGKNVRVVRNAPTMECQPCDQKKCPQTGMHCMTKIKLNDIKRAIAGLINRPASRV